MKSSYLLLLLSFFSLITISIAQDEHSRTNTSEDLSHSVFGPPQPAVWEFQLSYMNEGTNNISSFNFYKKDQRNKTLFFKISDNGLNNRNEFRVQELTGGAVLFPINDDDRYQLDIGGTYDKMKDTSLYGKAFYSRVTLRPQPNLWFRIGAEYFDGSTAGHNTLYRNTVLNSFYFVGKVNVNKFSLVGLLGKGKIDDVQNTRFGFAGILEGPFNTFILGGYIKSDEPKENVRTLAIGRWAPFRPDGLPSTVFIWKHRDNYDFQLGGIFWGGNNLFVRPAAIGMSQGMFISSAALRENSELRQGQLMSITDDYRNSDFTLFYIYLDQGIEMIPGSINHVGFRAIQLFKIFSEVKFSIFSKPVIGLFYNEETEPEFNAMFHKFIDKQSTFWSFQAGITFYDSFILNIINTPSRGEWTLALSFLMK
ncbi:MAG: hypothetical protein NTZ27_13365 [Ignavibacteriales bacterium]|nr:hypothetical protein [Ignavibacteriales bacterium]